MNTPTPHEDERLRSLLADAVADVEPRDRLAAIHARTTHASRRRPWLLVAAGAVAATAATVTAVTVLGDGGTSPEPGFAGPSTSSAPTTSSAPSTSPAPSASASPAPSPSAGAAEQGPGVVYYLGSTASGPRLFREIHLDRHSNDPLQAVRTAVVARPSDPDYWTPWPEGTAVDTGFDGIGDDGQISIELFNADTDLRDRPAGMRPDEAAMAVEQLIYTAQAVTRTRAPVQFYLARNGSPYTRTDTLLGVPVSEPLAAGDPADVLAQVMITNQAEGSEVTSPFEVSGLAAAFEANVLWEVWDVSGEDRLVDSGYATAKECCTMAPYSFTLDLPPGTYQVVVMDQDMETGEPSFVDTKSITVLP